MVHNIGWLNIAQHALTQHVTLAVHHVLQRSFQDVKNLGHPMRMATRVGSRRERQQSDIDVRAHGGSVKQDLKKCAVRSALVPHNISCGLRKHAHPETGQAGHDCVG